MSDWHYSLRIFKIYNHTSLSRFSRMPFGIIQTHGKLEPPGTEYLVDNAQTSTFHQYEHSHLKHGTGKNAGIILVPQPSDDPNDPLLWPSWKKEAAFIVIFANAVIFATCPGPLLASSTFALAPLLGVTLTEVSLLSGYQLMLVGILGPIVSVLAQKYGKRPQFLFATVLGTVGTIICIAGRSNYEMLLAGRVIQGFGATAFESLSLATVGDIFYLHDRGWRTALIVLTLACMASLVSIISGVITNNLGYKNLFIILLPFQIAGLLGTVFFLPESQFIRKPRETLAVQNTDEKNIDHDVEIRHEETKTDGMDAPTQQQSYITTSDSAIPKKTYIQTLAPFTQAYTDRNVFVMFAEIFVHLLNPAVVWILLTSAVMVSLFAATAYIMAQIWSVPPYNLTVEQNGYFFAGAFIGGLLAVSAGWMCDQTARSMARLNKGTFEAEFRILVNILAAVLLGIGWFVFMWDVNNPTTNGYYLGAFCHACITFGITITSTTGGLYILDAFRKYATEIFILQMMTKNLLFFMFSKFINAWEVTDGAGHIFGVFGIISMVLLATSIPMYIFGKVNRKFVHGIHDKFSH